MSILFDSVDVEATAADPTGSRATMTATGPDDLDPGGTTAGDTEAPARLVRFRAEVHRCFTRRGDTLFDLADAMLCASGPVRSPAELSVEPECRRGHGAAYAALARGRIDTAALRRLQAAHIDPARAGEPLMFSLDTTPLARPDAAHTDGRTMVHLRRKGGDAFLPGFDYSMMVGVGWGASSWVSPLDARRLPPGANLTALTVAQVRGVLADLAATGTATPTDPAPLLLFDAGYDPLGLA